MTTSRRTARIALAAIALVIVVACVRVASTHRVFSLTMDEPIHIYSGYDWLTGAPYNIDIEHPPLTRMTFAAALVWKGTPPPERMPLKRFWKEWWKPGMFLLEHGNEYRTRVAEARRGNLIFLALGIAAVAAWAWRRLGPHAAVIAALLFSMLPPVLAHAGLATTDMGGTALFAWALVALEWFIDRPTLRRAIVFGLVAGLAVSAKFSFIPFFGVAGTMIVVVRQYRPTRALLASAAAAFVVVWGMYRFEVTTIERSYERAMEMVELTAPWHARPVAEWVAKNVPIPAPNFLNGMLDVALHNRRGHGTNYLFGKYKYLGWWYYFPVCLAMKTPIAYLLLMLAGMGIALRKREWLLPAIVLAMLFMTFRVHINIGVRHVLPLYVPMSLLAASVLVHARGLWRIGAAVLVAGNIGVSVAAHPDYIPWFNVLAGEKPYRVLADSNYDWSQDALRLARKCRELGVNDLLYTYYFLIEPALPPNRPASRRDDLRGRWVAFRDAAPDDMKKLGWKEEDLAVFGTATRRYRVGKTTTLLYIPK